LTADDHTRNVGPVTDRSVLVGSWSHSHEEDHDGLQVFRPGDDELPPSRGRTTLTLRADATAVAGTPGPADVGRLSDGGSWELDGDVLRVRCPGWTATYEVVSAEPAQLKLRPV